MSEFTHKGTVIRRNLRFGLMDAHDTHAGLSVDNGDSIKLEISQSVRVASEDFRHGLVYVPNIEMTFVLDVEQIDDLIQRLTLAKSLLGQDFIIFDHVPQYRIDGVDYDFDGNMIPESD